MWDMNNKKITLSLIHVGYIFFLCFFFFLSEAPGRLSLQLCLSVALIGCWHFVMKSQWIFSALIPAGTPTLNWVNLCSMTGSLLIITCRRTTCRRTRYAVIPTGWLFVIMHSPLDPLHLQRNTWTTTDLSASLKQQQDGNPKLTSFNSKLSGISFLYLHDVMPFYILQNIS